MYACLYVCACEMGIFCLMTKCVCVCVQKILAIKLKSCTTYNARQKFRALVCPPRSIELKDLKGHLHQLDVKVLGTEETWNTPSLLLAKNQKSGGSAVFSQVSNNNILNLSLRL